MKTRTMPMPCAVIHSSSWSVPRLPDEADLASQPTLSRLENAVGYKACYHLAMALVQLYLQERGCDGVPERIVLDFDGTDDPAHGHQEGVAYHGYYSPRCVGPPGSSRMRINVTQSNGW